MLLDTEIEMIEAAQKIKEDANEASAHVEGSQSKPESKPEMV